MKLTTIVLFIALIVIVGAAYKFIISELDVEGLEFCKREGFDGYERYSEGVGYCYVEENNLIRINISCQENGCVFNSSQTKPNLG